MRILLIGASGQIGWELARALAPLGSVVAPPRSALDLALPGSISAAIDAAAPDVIMNAAGYTNVDQAEQEPALAARVNTDAPAELATCARRRGALYVQYSSDYVFDGRKAGKYHEDDATSPLNIYGRTLRDGERAVRESGAEHVIFRTSWVYGARGRNFLRTILAHATGPTLRVVADQFGAPTWARHVADTTAVALQQDLAGRRAGTFRSATLHLTASGATSWHGFASAIVKNALALGVQLECREVAAISSSEYPRAAARPRNSTLDGAMLAKRYGVHMPPWEAGLALCLADMFG
jgi:dTDP-4-dehydrorhamnose reductase